MNIAWGITGAGSYLEETLETAGKLSRANNKVTFFVSEAGEEVLKTYGLLNALFDLVSDEYLDEIMLETKTTVSTSKIGRFMLNKYNCLVISPTTSNSVAKMAYGISDSLISNLFTSATKSRVKTLVVPVDYVEDKSLSPIVIDRKKCKRCERCFPKEECPNEAIKNYKIIHSRCDGCGACVEVCSYDAVEKKEISIKPRKLDLENVAKLEKMEKVKVIKNPSKVIEEIDF